jgi:DNA polymerase
MAGDAALTEWLRYLEEIGVRELRIDRAPRFRPPFPEEGDVAIRAIDDGASPDGRDAPIVELERAVRIDALRGARDRPLRELERESPTGPGAAQPPLLGGSDFEDPPPSDPAAALRVVRADIGDCRRCPLHEQRTNIVFGVGNPRAKLMFVGEGPGADEDAQGEPFVGRAGKKLDQMIAAIGLAREDVYIANVVKCRPPGNREPRPDEVATCSPYLFRQIEAIRPRVIVTLGSPAARTLLDTRTGITALRGQWQSYRGIPVMPTYHPAYLLRAYTADNRRKVFADLKAARARMDESA